MPYKLEDFKRLGIYEEKSDYKECNLEGGVIIARPKVSEKIRELLNSSGGRSHGGDGSRQDSAVITSLLSAGLSPADAYATFEASPRGQDAQARKNGHFADYMRRTIERAAAFLENSEKISVNFAVKKPVHNGTGLVVSMGHEIETEKTHWIWPGYIPAGKLTIIAGDPGMGKSTMVGDIISRISRGTFLPSGQRSITGTSLIASAEDSPEDTIIPRLIACGANLKRVGIIREVRQETKDDESKYLTFPRDLELLKNTIVSTGARLLIIDPLTAFIEKGSDSYKDQDMRRILHPVESIAQETGCSVVIVAHLNKKEDASTLYRVGGTIGFIAAARSVLGVTRMDDDQKVLYSLKVNLARKPMSMAYEIKEVRKRKTEQNSWLGEDVIQSSAIRWLGEVDFDPMAKANVATPDSVALEEASIFLREVLRDGQLEVDEVYSQAKHAGISKNYVNKAKSVMGCASQRRLGKWYWQLPESEQA
jgi:archaellum biogenesis ATPase FlaH